VLDLWVPNNDLIKTAGTFATKKEAEKAGYATEEAILAGRMSGAALGKLTFRKYVGVGPPSRRSGGQAGCHGSAGRQELQRTSWGRRSRCR
jgi:hypothetical protein